MQALPEVVADGPGDTRADSLFLRCDLQSPIPAGESEECGGHCRANNVRGLRRTSPGPADRERSEAEDLRAGMPRVALRPFEGIAGREKVVARLEAEGAEDLARPLRECGTGIGLICTNCGERHETVTRCKKRWCPACARIVSAKRLEKYSGVIDLMRSPIFVTLTMPHTAETSSPDDVRKLRRALGRFRNRAWFKRRVSGGIASIEVTCGENGWHPHVHMLIEARWFSVTVPSPDGRYSKKDREEMQRASQQEILWQWQRALAIDEGGGVFISRARFGVAREILKYAVKPGDLVEAQWPLAPLLRVLSVSRLITTWGSVRKAHQKIASLQDDDEKRSLICSCGESAWLPEELTPRHDKQRAAKKTHDAATARAKHYARERRDHDLRPRPFDVGAAIRGL